MSRIPRWVRLMLPSVVLMACLTRLGSGHLGRSGLGLRSGLNRSLLGHGSRFCLRWSHLRLRLSELGLVWSCLRLVRPKLRLLWSDLLLVGSYLRLRLSELGLVWSCLRLVGPKLRLLWSDLRLVGSDLCLIGS
jgi:hypothetical protein